jgi:hypothetical protein
MRISPVILLAALCGCDIANEPEKDQVTLTYDEQRIKDAADKTKRTAKEVGTGVVNVTKGTAEAIKREVGDVDVDVTVTRKPPEPAQ